MKWSPEQERALDTVADWLHAPTPFLYLAGYAGTGKALADSMPVQTPSGPVYINDLHVGDDVFGMDGTPIKVTGVFPQGDKMAYRVTFRDGAYVDCCKDHIWSVWTHKRRSKNGPTVDMTTEEILRSGVKFPSEVYKYSIPLTAPVEYAKTDLPIDPYMLGALIGDGTNLGITPTMCSPDRDHEIIDRIQSSLWHGMQINKSTAPSCPQHRIVDTTQHGNRLTSAMREVGLAHKKSPERFIPIQYLTACIDDRLEMLRGLMDTDGACINNRTSYSTHSSRLANDIIELVQSLGGTAILRRLKNRPEELNVNVKMFVCPFHLKRKAAHWKPSWKNPPSRFIVDIKPLRKQPHTCIKVDAADGLFLTKDYVVTHNTSIAKHLAEGVRGEVLFAAFTGKAASVMRAKGCENATTIHRLIYQSASKSTKRLKELQEQLAEAEDGTDAAIILRGEIQREIENIKKPNFSLNYKSDVRGASLVILDECSMINERMVEDLMSFKTPILVLGDPAQLPPVGSAGYFTKHKPDIMLTEVHRQARGSGILDLATRIRLGEQITHGDYGDAQVIARGEIGPQEVLTYDQILVGTNRKRHMTNARMRELLERTSPFPMIGDRLVCTRNNHDLGLLNGEIYETIAAEDMDTETMRLEVSLDEVSQDLDVWKAPFLGEKLQAFSYDNEIQEFAYGYALTTHKAQGSQWPRVIVFDESACFRNDAQKWLYTAVTRASDYLTLVI